MTMKNQNFEMFAGDTKPIVVNVIDENGVPLDLSGSIIKWGLRRGEFSTENLVLKSTPEIEIDADKITIKLLPEDTKLLSGSNFFHECECTDQLGDVSTLFTGKVKILFSAV
jgi:hypothetical protein